jgi:hypothetical protein
MLNKSIKLMAFKLPICAWLRHYCANSQLKNHSLSQRYKGLTVKESAIWVFHSAGAQFSGGVFSTIELAESWILENKLSGLLTAYPIDFGVYNWAVENQFFSPKHERHRSSSFIGGFTSARQEHFHY